MPRPVSLIASLVFALIVVLLLSLAASASSYRVMFSFAPTGANPSSGLVTDAAGNAYGTTSGGGFNGAGTVYELSPTTGYHLLYEFNQLDGWQPQGNLVFDSAGNLYGTTFHGGPKNSTLCGRLGCGLVFKLSPPTQGNKWTETILHYFCSQANCADGSNPAAGLILDGVGNLYGTTEAGGFSSNCCGTVFEMSVGQSGWTENVLYSFGFPNDASGPEGGLIFDDSGNLYSTTAGGGGIGNGTVFELSASGGTWSETILYAFGSGCASPRAGVAFDSAGNIFGTTDGGSGSLASGCVFELIPDGVGGWNETVIHAFKGGTDGANPMAEVVFDPSGNLYGTTIYGGTPQACDLNGSFVGCGTVFEFAPQGNGQWTESVFRFAPSGEGGYWPTSPVTLDSFGNIYGVSTSGGRLSSGVMFRITP